jgi:hypothetical protein
MSHAAYNPLLPTLRPLLHWHHPPRHRKLPLKIKPRLLLRQQQLDPHKDHAGGLKGSDGLGVGELAELEPSVGVVILRHLRTAVATSLRRSF